MMREAIILSGGLGTRLRQAVPDLPKTMAPVAGKPFLYYVIQHLMQQGIKRMIFSLGYKHEMITRFVQQNFPDLETEMVIEEEPLGTGGAIVLASRACKSKDVIVTNGDTLYKANIEKLLQFHQQHKAECTLTLKPMRNFDRYGVVVTDAAGRVESFLEKANYEEGLINGGMYALNLPKFHANTFPEKFSFETGYLEKQNTDRKLMAMVQDEYFIDIGIPEDFERAGKELQHSENQPANTGHKPLPRINENWTLFLDRDGVINYEKQNDYIHTWDEFRFYEGVTDAMKTFAEKFGKIVVVTNQRGVGRGLTLLENLNTIHQNMQAEVEKSGGRIDAIFYCDAVDSNHPNRKPNPGMGHLAKEAFPSINFSKSIMVGNTLSDMEFGRNIGAFTVFLPTTRPEVDLHHPAIDATFPTLKDFADAL